MSAYKIASHAARPPASTWSSGSGLVFADFSPDELLCLAGTAVVVDLRASGRQYSNLLLGSIALLEPRLYGEEWFAKGSAVLGLYPGDIVMVKEIRLERDEPLTVDRDVEWIESHGSEISLYVGKWIAVAGGKVVAAHKDSSQVLNEARRQGHQDPLLVKVPPSDTPLIL